MAGRDRRHRGDPGLDWRAAVNLLADRTFGVSMSNGIGSRPERPPITQEELDLLATPGVELERCAYVLSFDEAQFRARISGGERWQQLIQAHLYFDHVISLILTEALVKPEAINASRMGFSQKLDLIQALNLAPNDLVNCVRFVNNLRNKIAHDLHFEISDKEEIDLINVTPKLLRDIMITEKDRAPGPLRFHEALIVSLLRLEVIRQQNALFRILAKKSEVRLRTVLEKTPGAVYRE